MLFFSELRIEAIIIIIKGFKSSIGWNFGKNKKSTHLFDPFTSIPVMGTNNKKTKKTINNIMETLNKLSRSNSEKKNYKKKTNYDKKQMFKKEVIIICI